MAFKNGYLGALISRERLRKDWSMEGLCRGICSVSYLSKIENGKADPSQQILQQLLARLDLATDAETELIASQKAQRAWALLLGGRPDAFTALAKEDALRQTYRATEAGMDWLLFRCLFEECPADEQMERFMDARQLAMQRVLQGKVEEALALCPNAYFHWQAGLFYYNQGNEASSLQYLQAAYDMAAQQGEVHLMLLCKTYIGNIYCNKRDIAAMRGHYSVAFKLAEAVGNTEIVSQLRYNEAAAQIELGEYKEACSYLKSIENPGVMELHKLAICFEKLGEREAALSALSRADAAPCEFPPKPLAQMMCQIVRLRLLHADYLQQQQEYGSLLMRCFSQLRSELPVGYAAFHLPWVLEYLKATRQYKLALEISQSFSSITA
ncbi:MAG: helix-turn-helix transcriptional regulator [Oscillospiraceae bacterium]|nr:helix-turn-helix transcriptional regulator [Oscillospiraceae bacterium]